MRRISESGHSQLHDSGVPFELAVRASSSGPLGRTSTAADRRQRFDDQPCDGGADACAGRIHDEIADSGMTAWIPELGDFDCSGKADERHGLMKVPEAVPKTECKPGRCEYREVLHVVRR